MDRTRKATREGNEATLHHRTESDALRIAEIVAEKLVALEALIEQLKQAPARAAELARRIKTFGECRRSDEETTTEFYDKLRHWLELTIPQTKLPLHPPRQTNIRESSLKHLD